MAKQNVTVCSQDLFSFRGMRRIALRRAWEKAKELEEAGKPVLKGDFGRLLREAWDEIAEAQRACPVPE